MPRDHVRLVSPTLEVGAVALITPGESIWLLRFDGDQLVRTEVGRGFLPSVSGGQLSAIAPAIVPGGCAYVQSRQLVLYDFARRTAETRAIAADLEEMPVEARWAAVEPRILVALVEDTSRYDDGGRLDFRLRSYAIDGRRARPLGALELGSFPGGVASWAVGRGLAAVFDDVSFAVRPPDLGAPQDHPLARAAQGLLGAGLAIEGLHIHPSREEAVILAREGDEESGIARVLRVVWADPAEPKVEPLAEGAPRDPVRLGEIAPDGRWVTLLVRSSTATMIHACQLGDDPSPPVLLGAVASVDAICWTGSTAALWVFDGEMEMVLRWDLAPAGG